MLHHSSHVGTWVVDVKAAASMAHTDNVLDTVVANLGRLPADTRECLALASCASQVFSPAYLAEVTGLDAQALLHHLRIATEYDADAPLALCCAGHVYQLPEVTHEPTVM